MSRRVKTRKPIALDTTLRNPRRIPQFISVLSDFEGKILTDEMALRLEAEIIKQKIFEPTKGTLGTYVKTYDKKFKFEAKDKSSNAPENVEIFYDEWAQSNPGEYDINNIIYLLENTITQRKDRGWKGGWESRIHTQFNFLNELGLVQVIKNEEVKISKNGHLMITEYENGFPKEDEYSTAYEESAFLNAFAKYQVNNPYRSNTIKVSLFLLVLGVISELKSLGYDNGILINELAFIISWGNNDYKQLAKFIHRFREKYGYNASEELIYSYAMNILSHNNFENVSFKEASNEYLELKGTHFKIEKLLHETPDELVRKLRLTMLITLRGAGRFIDINELQKDKVKHILKNYSENQEFKDIDIYFDYMGSIDNQLLLDVEPEESKDILDAKNNKILEYTKLLDWQSLNKEMNVCFSKSGSNDNALKYVEAPARFEFLVAVALRKALPNVIIKANYIADDEGLPFTTASGKTSKASGADIDIYENNTHVLAEPTISNAESFQVDHEIPSIRRHMFAARNIDAEVNPHINEWFALFIAGNIREDVGNQIASVLDNSNIEIYPWEVDDFIQHSQSVASINDYKLIREYAKVKIFGG